MFDGTNDSLSRAAFVQALGAVTVFMVLKPGTLATSKFFMSEDSTASANPLNFLFATSATTATSGRNFVRNDASATAHSFNETNQWASNTDTIAGLTDNTSSAITIYKDGTAYPSRATSRSGVYSMTDFILGRRANGGTGSCTACTIREVIIYSGVLSQANREIVEGALAHRWGLTGLLPALHPYKSSAPTVNI